MRFEEDNDEVMEEVGNCSSRDGRAGNLLGRWGVRRLRVLPLLLTSAHCRRRCAVLGLPPPSVRAHAMNQVEREDLNRAMTRLAEGDRTAFEVVYAATWPILRRFSSRLLQRSADADDVAQEALLKVFERASEFDARRDALAWALGIAAYECRTHLRKVSRRRESFDPDELGRTTHRGPTPEAAAVERDLERAAFEVLESLTPIDVETILVATREGSRPRIPAATFRKRLERAVHRLRLAWRAEHGNE